MIFLLAGHDHNNRHNKIASAKRTKVKEVFEEKNIVKTKSYSQKSKKKLRRKIMKMNKLVMFLLIIVLLLPNCLIGVAQEKVITFARPEDIQFMDPYDNINITNIIMDYLIYDRLVDYNPETGVGFVPALATEWSVSSDGTEYTFKLKQGVSFHNGEPFSAECVKVSLERFINEKLRRGSDWETLKEVEIIDDYTVIVKFSQPNVVCLTNLVRTPMLPAKAFQEKGAALFDNPIGTGAFTFTEWRRGQHIIAEKYPDYWGEPAYIDKFIYLPINEDSTRLAGVLRGEIDIADTMPPDQVPAAEADPNVEVIRMLAWDQIYLGLKADTSPFTDKKFRQAVTLSLDRENIVKFILKGGRPSTGNIPMGVFGFDDSLAPVKRDIEKAKQLVEESIYDGREIRLIAPTGWYPKTKDVTQAIQAGLIEIGVNVNLEILDGATFAERRGAGNYDIYYTGASQPGDVDSFIWQRIYNDAMASGYVNNELNQLIEDQRQEVDSEKRIEMLREIENIINTEVAPHVFVYQMEHIYFQRKGIEGYRYYGNKCPDLRYVHYAN